MSRPRTLLLAVLLAASPAAICALQERAALADEERGDIEVGTELEATTDVTLHTAEIVKGSKVSVTKLLGRAGQVDGVSVALADGHVVKVTMRQVRSYFRVVRD